MAWHQKHHTEKPCQKGNKHHNYTTRTACVACTKGALLTHGVLAQLLELLSNSLFGHTSTTQLFWPLTLKRECSQKLSERLVALAFEQGACGLGQRRDSILKES